MSREIVRIAARGDGVTADGSHVAFAVPGDLLLDDGTLQRGPGHQLPPCRHFPACGGCQLQHLTDTAYADYCTSRIAGALAQHGLEAELHAAHISPPRSRRRATLRALKAGGRVLIGFNEAGSNRIVDMQECHILEPRLFALLAPLRVLLGRFLPQRRTAEVQMTLADQGVDLLLKGVEVEGLDAVEAVAAFSEAQRLARLSIDEGLGAEPRYEPRPVTVDLGGIPVALPVGAFLQATADGEAALLGGALEAVGGVARVADLFAGLGTFALGIPETAIAAEASREAVLSLKTAAARAGRVLEVQHRDLYRRPLDRAELAGVDAVLLDPPRAGAQEQIRELAASSVARIAYVSCNPSTFARDAALLVGGGYRLEWVRPVGQFRWSTHVELVAAFSR
ncbi:class I SAM-dependent RNA methyltransferase [Sphingomonas xanthus]|uniref:Class I SAM-dependent RNA methyltransferase n=1 Tax=Sphingomonas xanthus TaxID=2594473 RepID=A0A516INT0_9SPHN|nr:class I SAM-dependent RNA methyltransferase [Sphingomonas xanthus]QDP18575.1 class I SAM-dependent RNA methyltransferase [Sphingomonas xanthus]